MDKITAYVTARLGENSTLTGILILLFGLAGFNLTEADAVQVLAAGQIIAGAVKAVLPDKLGKP